MPHILIKPMPDNETKDRGINGLWYVVCKDLATKVDTIHAENLTYEAAVKEAEILNNEINFQVL